MVKILGVKIDVLDPKAVMAEIADFLNNHRLHQIATVNPEFLVAAERDQSFKVILNKSDLNIPDGFGLQCAAWFLGQKIGPRYTGVDLTWDTLKYATEHEKSVYFLGGGEGVAQKAAERAKLVHPALKIAGTDTSKVSADGSASDALIDNINNSKADILLVALGAPKQEKFIDRYRNNLKVKLAIGVGGTFDYIAGTASYAPAWMRSLGLEWLYRLITQPKRWKRILNAVIVFPLLVIGSKFGKK